MCVTQLKCIEIKGNYGAPVCCHPDLAISNLLFQVLLTFTKARHSLAGRNNNITTTERQRLAAIDVNSSEVSTVKVSTSDFSLNCPGLGLLSPGLFSN